MFTRTLSAILMCASLVACADEDERLDDGLHDQDLAELTLDCADQLPAVDTAAPIFLYYGAYRPSASLPASADSSQTMALASAPGERVLSLRRAVSSCVARDAELAPWRASGGQVAHIMSIEELEHLFDTGRAADRIEAFLRSGYGYVAIDEIARDLTAWRDGQPRAQAWHRLLADLAARGLDRRVILYVNSYNLAGAMARYSSVLADARDHARVVASEIYLITDHVMRSHAGRTQAEVAGKCNRNLSCFNSLAQEMGAAAPGINYRTITLLGVSDEYNQGRLDSLCGDASARGALYHQYAALHAGRYTRLQPGVGGYTIARVIRTDHPSWGPADQAACLQRLNGWSAWPDAR